MEQKIDKKRLYFEFLKIWKASRPQPINKQFKHFNIGKDLGDKKYDYQKVGVKPRTIWESYKYGTFRRHMANYTQQEKDLIKHVGKVINGRA